MIRHRRKVRHKVVEPKKRHPKDILDDFTKKLVGSQRELDYAFQKVVNDNFWELLEHVKVINCKFKKPIPLEL